MEETQQNKHYLLLKCYSLFAVLFGEGVKRTRWCQVDLDVCYLTLLKNVH